MARRAWLSPPPLLALLLALAAAALCGAQLPHAKHSDPPVVVVVTWFRKNLTWLAQVPPARARVVIYSKGGGPDYTCASLPPFLTPPLLAFCADSFNADGREAHTMALFVADNLHNLPRLVLFLQDDEPVYKPVSRLSQLSDDAFAAWMSHVEAVPFANYDLCMCALAHENGFVPGTYGYYGPLLWFLRNFVSDRRVWDEGRAIRWATGAQFIVPSALIRRWPLSLYRTLEALHNGSVEAPPAMTALGMDGLGWAHVLERAWFALWDPAYSPHQARFTERLADANISWVTHTHPRGGLINS